MSIVSFFKKMNVFYKDKFLTQQFPLQVFICLNIVAAYKFAFNFYKNENSDVSFFVQRQDTQAEVEANIEKYALRLYYNQISTEFNQQDPVFTYTKDNFIKFVSLNNISQPNSLENDSQNGNIECNFDLSYFLKLSKDIIEIPINFNIYQLKCFLLTLKFLQAVDDKNIVRFLQVLIYKTFLYSGTNHLNQNDTNCGEIFDVNFVSQFDFYMNRNLIIAFLDILMIKYVFYDGNLILLEKSRELYSSLHFNEHIPYKNLLVDNYKIFCILENTLKNHPYFLYIFQILLNQINIKSLIINNYEEIETHAMNLHSFIVSFIFLKSIVIINKYDTSNAFLFNPNSIIRKDIEFLSLENLMVEISDLVYFLKGQKLKGLILDYVDLQYGDNFSVEYNMRLNSEYIQLINVQMNFLRWRDFFNFANFSKIILKFDNFLVQKNVLSHIIQIYSYENVFYLEITFCKRYILSSFHKLLNNFKYLRTLKLNRYISDEKTEFYLFETIKSMKYLENLTINLPKTEILKNSDYFFLVQNFKFLCLECINFEEEILNIKFWRNYRSLSTFILKNTKINESDFIEILKLEFLINLSFLSCVIKCNFSNRFLEFFSKNIKSLDFTGTDLDTIKNLDIFNMFLQLEKLNLSKCNLKSGHLTQINNACNLTLKTLFYDANILDKHDLNRIKNLEFLEELNLRDCKFYGCSFFELGNDCKFLNNLKYLDIEYVEINLNDLIYLKMFKNLKDLKLTLSASDFLSAKKILAYLPITILTLGSINEDYIYYYSYSDDCIFYEENLRYPNLIFYY